MTVGTIRAGMGASPGGPWDPMAPILQGDGPYGPPTTLDRGVPPCGSALAVNRKPGQAGQQPTGVGQGSGPVVERGEKEYKAILGFYFVSWDNVDGGDRKRKMSNLLHLK